MGYVSEIIPNKPVEYWLYLEDMNETQLEEELKRLMRSSMKTNYYHGHRTIIKMFDLPWQLSACMLRLYMSNKSVADIIKPIEKGLRFDPPWEGKWRFALSGESFDPPEDECPHSLDKFYDDYYCIHCGQHFERQDLPRDQVMKNKIAKMKNRIGILKQELHISEFTLNLAENWGKDEEE